MPTEHSAMTAIAVELTLPKLPSPFWAPRNAATALSSAVLAVASPW